MVGDVSMTEQNIMYLRQEIESTFNSLSHLDHQRLKQLQGFLQGSDGAGEWFIRSTQETLVLLEGFERSFLGVMAHILLKEHGGHHSPAFQQLVQRYKLMEKPMRAIRKLREQQVRAAQQLMKSTGLLKRYYLHRLQRALRREEDLVNLIEALYQHGEAEFHELGKALALEQRKANLVQGAAITSLGVPVLGTVLYVGITSVYQWANRYSKNYKEVRRLAA